MPTPSSPAPASSSGDPGDKKIKSSPPPPPSPDLVSNLLDRCEVTHFSEIYERWVDAREGAVTLSDLQAFNALFNLEKVREDVNRHPLLLLAHPPRPAALKVPGGDTWYVVDHRGLKLWIKRIFAIKADAVGQQVSPDSATKLPVGNGAGPNGIGLVVSLAEIQGYLGVNEDQAEKLDLLLERATSLPGVFLRRTQANATLAGGTNSNGNGRSVPAHLVYYQQLSRFRVPAKRRLLYQLLAILVIFVISLFFLLPFLRGL